MKDSYSRVKRALMKHSVTSNTHTHTHTLLQGLWGGGGSFPLKAHRGRTESQESVNQESSHAEWTHTSAYTPHTRTHAHTHTHTHTHTLWINTGYLFSLEFKHLKTLSFCVTVCLYPLTRLLSGHHPPRQTVAVSQFWWHILRRTWSTKVCPFIALID